MNKIDEKIVKFIVEYYKETQFYPNYDEIGKHIGRVKSSVHAHMKKMENEGIIVRKSDCSSQYRFINMDIFLQINN